MGLVTSLAFQHSPAIQSRAFLVLGTLAASDVDNDFMYQVLVAFKTAMAKSNETDTTSVVSMLRCMCKVVSALPLRSKYFRQLFWLAVALLQASHVAFYVQATDLLRRTLEMLQAQDAFRETSVADVLWEGRAHLEGSLGQLDQLLGLSFETNFSFSLVAIIFKGIRHTGLRSSGEAALRSLLRVTVQAVKQAEDTPEGTLPSDALGYFIALIPLSTSRNTYERLLQDCNISGIDINAKNAVPRVSLDIINIDDSSTALLTTSFIGAMLTTAQGDDAETQMLYTLLSDIASIFPDIVSMTYVFNMSPPMILLILLYIPP
jgi:neurofibromin 1